MGRDATPHYQLHIIIHTGHGYQSDSQARPSTWERYKNEGTSSTGSISTLTGGSPSSLSSRKPKKARWTQLQKTAATAHNNNNYETFKGVNESLKGKVFIIGPDQASRYDDVMKALLGYVSSHYDHRVRSSIEHKDKNVGLKLLTKPVAPKMTDPNDTTKEVLDKDGEEWIIYQIRLKKYIDRVTKLEDDLQQIFNIIIGQCSPGMEQALSGMKDFKTINEEANSLDLIKAIEQICYNYQPHEYPPLGAWEALDKLGKSFQPENVREPDH